MLKFAVMQLRWEFRKDESTAVQRFRYQDAGLRHDVAFNAEGEPVLHLISEIQASADSGFQDYELSTGIAYAILPGVFEHADHPTLKEPLIRIALQGGYVMAFPKGHVIPTALPLYAIAFEHAGTKNHFVLIHVAGKKVTVAAFSGQKPLLINTFPAGNEAEALYFALGPFKRAGIAVSEVEVEILSDSNLQAPLLQLFGRFLVNVKPCPVSLPYEVGQYPPHADISLLLFTLSQCGLPAAN
ncbi:MAG: DUF3822 family protein [Bacteroidetes bacterium]|nr:DUF3822 family protein [Bacteroidota bacterium]